MESPQFENTFQTLPNFLFESVTPTPLSQPRLIHVTDLKAELGLSALDDDELMQWLNGERVLTGEQRIATRYAGHQFGVWAGQLGDGRAISLGELVTEKHGRQEIQTKGSGETPFSRRGDGRAVIRSSVREYLCSEAMYGLGIPTTRVLALITGADSVQRETVESSALIARVFPTNLRFGHFELCYHFQKKAELKALIDYVKAQFFPKGDLETMLREIVKRTALLMAHWQNVGFCHGVMNTDNMSLLGVTIDYGPFGFLEDTVLDHICNHTDHEGRYAFDQQHNIGAWNLERLLVCFKDYVPVQKLKEILDSYPYIFRDEYLAMSRKKLGLTTAAEEDQELFLELLRLLHDERIDFTYFFRRLSSYQMAKPESLNSIFEIYGSLERLRSWLLRYDQRLLDENSDDSKRSLSMRAANPKYILRNYIAQEVIESVEKGESERLSAWLQVLYRPFDEHPEFEKYSLPTPKELKHFEVSCSS
jgi:uncharacterized protein YdiU (UPF0061 family)